MTRHQRHQDGGRIFAFFDVLPSIGVSVVCYSYKKDYMFLLNNIRMCY
jgi:hypothetical protein